MERNTEPAALDASLLQQHRGRTLDSRGRNDETLSPSAQGRHPEQCAIGTDDGAAIVARPQIAVEDDAVVYRSTRKTLPSGACEKHHRERRPDALGTPPQS